MKKFVLSLFSVLLVLSMIGSFAACSNKDEEKEIKYPYFFVNLETQGVPGVLMWIAILSVAFVAMGFAFYGLDRISKKQKDKE